MCLSIPGKITKMSGDQLAIANFNGIEKEIDVSLVDAKIGEYVMVHAGFAIEKMRKEDAESVNDLFK